MLEQVSPVTRVEDGGSGLRLVKSREMEVRRRMSVSGFFVEARGVLLFLEVLLESSAASERMRMASPTIRTSGPRNSAW